MGAAVFSGCPNTDADVDGYQIRTLILTMLWRLTPTLIEQGYVYIAESPLYEISAGGKTWFAYSEKEKAEVLAGLDGKKPVIQRSKGLGENDPEMMWMTTMNPDTRRLIRVMPDEAALTAQVFDLLLGENAQGRKEHIAENGYKQYTPSMMNKTKLYYIVTHRYYLSHKFHI